MADKYLGGLNAISGDPADADLLGIEDIDFPAECKKIAFSDLRSALLGGGDLADLSNVGTDDHTSGNVLVADGADWDSATPDAAGLLAKSGVQTGIGGLKTFDDGINLGAGATFRLGTSATAGHLLTTDVSGFGTWQAVDISSASIKSLSDVYSSMSEDDLDLFYWDDGNSRWDCKTMAGLNIARTNVANTFGLKQTLSVGAKILPDVGITGKYLRAVDETGDVEWHTPAGAGDVTLAGAQEFITNEKSFEPVNAWPKMSAGYGDPPGDEYLATKKYVDDAIGIDTFAGLTDTEITGPTSLDLLQWNGTDWVDRTANEAGVLDKDTNQVVTSLKSFDVTSSADWPRVSGDYGAPPSDPCFATKKYVDDNIGGTLAGLTDTNINSPATGHFLQWDGTDWVNKTADYAGLVAKSGNQIDIAGNKTFTGMITLDGAVELPSGATVGDILYCFDVDGAMVWKTPDQAGLVAKSGSQASIAGNKYWTGVQYYTLDLDAGKDINLTSTGISAFLRFYSKVSLLRAGGKTLIDEADNTHFNSIRLGTVATSGHVLVTAVDGKGNWQALTAAQIPDLDTSKITTGAFASARIPVTITHNLTLSGGKYSTDTGYEMGGDFVIDGSKDFVGGNCNLPTGKIYKINDEYVLRSRRAAIANAAECGSGDFSDPPSRAIFNDLVAKVNQILDDVCRPTTGMGFIDAA